ncbi:MAG: sugar phosphate isomerase/epimerase family protein [Bacilli bacterium]
MRLGFLTNALVSPELHRVADLAEWAGECGFAALEVGPTASFDDEMLSRLREKNGVAVGCLTYCRNFLSGDEELDRKHQGELIQRIEAAGRNGIPVVVTATGIRAHRSGFRYDGYESIRERPRASMELVVSFFGRVLETAERHGVRVALENCPLMGNIAISPDLWGELFDRLDSDRLGIAYDPSHMVWQMMDPYAPIREFADRIFHIHAKDTEILRDRLARTGILTDFSWWRYRLPGLGEVDWTRFVSALREIGYEGMVSIEHEDPVWSGSPEKVRQGLLLAKRFLENVPGFAKVVV